MYSTYCMDCVLVYILLVVPIRLILTLVQANFTLDGRQRRNEEKERNMFTVQCVFACTV